MKKKVKSPGNEDNHYRGDYQPIDFADEFLSPNFHIGNVIKYVVRHKHKNGKEDLQKAIWYLERLQELNHKTLNVECVNRINKMNCDDEAKGILVATVAGMYTLAANLANSYMDRNYG